MSLCGGKGNCLSENNKQSITAARQVVTKEQDGTDGAQFRLKPFLKCLPPEALKRNGCSYKKAEKFLKSY